MYSQNLYRKSFFIRPMHCVLAVVGLFFVCISSFGQRPSSEGARRGLERIDQEEGARRLEAFRRQRLEGDYVFEFELEHKPRRARTVRYDGIMWGSWNEQGAVTRLKILPRDEAGGAANGLVELIIQNGPNPSAWIRRDSSGELTRVEGEALFEPLLPGLVYSVFDLQMPFIYWDEFEYEGPSLVWASRNGQRFLMIPPENSASARQGIKGVRMLLDDDYNALLRIEVIDGDENVMSEFSVERFKKVEGQYIVKRITLTDYPSEDRTTFNVVDASVGIQLDDKLFDVPEDNDSNVAAPEVSPRTCSECCQ